MKKAFMQRGFLAFVSMLLLSATLGTQFIIPVASSPIKIVLDLSHGQDSSWPYMNEFEGNLTAEGYELVWARGGLNDTVPALVMSTVRWGVVVEGFNVFPLVEDGISFSVVTVTNSSVSNFAFTKTDKKISFNVTGPEGTTGYCNVTIPKALLRAEPYWNWTILLNSVNITQYATILENGNYTYIYFTYNHTTQNIQIIGTWAIPEFPSAMILPLLLIITIIALIAPRRLFRAAIKQNNRT